MYPTFKRTRGKDKSPRKHQIKTKRTLTVSSSSGYDSKYVPAIRLNGKWLEDFDFHQGDKISVECREGELVIRKLKDE